MTEFIHISNRPMGTKLNQHYKLFAFSGTEKRRHQYYGLIWATNTDHAKDVIQREHFQIDDHLIVWLWPDACGTPGWGVVSYDQAEAIAAVDEAFA